MAMSGFIARSALGACLFCAPLLAQAIAVSTTAPVGNANNISRGTAVVVNFDRPLATASITATSFWVWGTQSGRVAGTIAFSNNNQTLTLTPSGPFFPGEWVSVQLSHAIGG